MLTGAIAQRVVLHHADPRHRELPAITPEGLCAWTAVGVTGVVVDKVFAREGVVGALGLVEHRDVRLDPAVIHQPVQHLGGAVAGVSDQSLRPQVEAVVSALDIMDLAAVTSAWRTAVEGSTSTITACCTSTR